MRRTGLALLATAITLGLVVPAGAQESVGRYRDWGDAGGFRNVVPPGQDGVINGPEQIQGQLTGTWPPHVDDQLGMYAGLIHRSPGLTEADLDELFKDASFGVPPEDVDRVYAPGGRDDVTVVRDASFGVPHIYGETREGTMFAMGYTGAEDRLFLMDVLRHTGRARLSEFLGASPQNQAFDRIQLSIAPYREQDLTAQTEPKEEFGQVAKDIRADAEAYVAGVNAYIREAIADPRKRPAEYDALQQLPAEWTLEDSVAIASLVGGFFGRGGGGELLNLCAIQEVTADVGADEARARFDDVARPSDAESPVTVEASFPYLTTELGAPDPEAVPPVDCGSLRPIGETGAPGPSDVLEAVASLVTVPPMAADGPFGPIPLVAGRAQSNALLIAGERTATGRPLAVFGPQTAYFVPQLLVEKDVHGPGISARGVSFAGTDLYVSLGRGADYAWSATSSKADNTDTFVLVLCEPGGGEPTVASMGHVHDGECLDIESWTHTQIAKPTAAGQPETPADLVLAWPVERSPVYGPLIARGTLEDGTPIAVASHRSTYLNETLSSLGFRNVNDPEFMADGFDSFREAMGEGLAFAFNWFYVDGRDIGVQHSCMCPVRADGVDPSLPTWGTGEWDWTARWMPHARQPWVRNPDGGVITSWNNRTARHFRGNDREFGYGPVHRDDLLTRRLDPLVARGDVTMVEAVEVMAEAATTSLRSQEVVPVLRRLLGDRAPGDADARVQQVWDAIVAWADDDLGHRRDHDDDGVYEHATAIAVMDAWWPHLSEAVLGELWSMFEATGEIVHDPPQLGLGSAYHHGTYGHVEKLARQALGEPVRDPLHRDFCGDGDLEVCRAAAWASFAPTLDDLEDEFGSSDPADWVRVPIDDAIVHTAGGIFEVPPIDWQNRPTFQQLVQLPGSVDEAPTLDAPSSPLPATGGGLAILALVAAAAGARRRTSMQAGRTR